MEIESGCCWFWTDQLKYNSYYNENLSVWDVYSTFLVSEIECGALTNAYLQLTYIFGTITRGVWGRSPCQQAWRGDVIRREVMIAWFEPYILEEIIASTTSTKLRRDDVNLWVLGCSQLWVAVYVGCMKLCGYRQVVICFESCSGGYNPVNVTYVEEKYFWCAIWY